QPRLPTARLNSRSKPVQEWPIFQPDHTGEASARKARTSWRRGSRLAGSTSGLKLKALVTMASSDHVALAQVGDLRGRKAEPFAEHAVGVFADGGWRQLVLHRCGRETHGAGRTAHAAVQRMLLGDNHFALDHMGIMFQVGHAVDRP